MKLKYVIKFVADMDRTVNFYRDVLGLPLKFQSPGWSEFVTGETILALHPASQKNLAGAVQPRRVSLNVYELKRHVGGWRNRGTNWERLRTTAASDLSRAFAARSFASSTFLPLITAIASRALGRIDS